MMIPARRPGAAEDAPGDVCATANWIETTGGPETAGVRNMLICDGAHWQEETTWLANYNVGIGTATPGSLLDIGLAGTTPGTLRLEGNTSGYVQLQTALVAGSWTMTLPPTAGTSGFVLQTNGAGTTSWLSDAASTTLNSMSAATGNQAGIANTNKTIVWKWDTLTNGTAMTLSSASMTTGNLLSVKNTNSASSTGIVLNVNNSAVGSSFAIQGVSSSTGAGTGVYGSITGAGNTNMAGYFSNTSVGANVGYGVYGITTSTGTGSAGVYGRSDTNWAGVWGTNGAASGGKGVYGVGGKYGVYARSNSGNNNFLRLFIPLTTAARTSTPSTAFMASSRATPIRAPPESTPTTRRAGDGVCMA
jgi:hypothetical protein